MRQLQGSEFEMPKRTNDYRLIGGGGGIRSGAWLASVRVHYCRDLTWQWHNASKSLTIVVLWNAFHNG